MVLVCLKYCPARDKTQRACHRKVVLEPGKHSVSQGPNVWARFGAEVAAGDFYYMAGLGLFNKKTVPALARRA
jgi:hypothetical protein